MWFGFIAVMVISFGILLHYGNEISTVKIF